jgi:hypothetical protein
LSDQFFDVIEPGAYRLDEEEKKQSDLLMDIIEPGAYRLDEPEGLMKQHL